MKRKEFKENLFAALDNDVDDITYDEKRYEDDKIIVYLLEQFCSRLARWHL